MQEIPLFTNVRKYYRYIDDLIIVWDGTETQLESFIGSCNANDRNIPFTYKNDHNTIEFIHIQFISDHEQIHTDICRKWISRNSLLHRQSSHPEPLLRGIAIGQFLRLRHYCSTWSAFQHTSMDLWDRLINRGYEINNIKKTVSSNRTELLTQSRRPQKENQNKRVNKQLRFITVYSSEAKEIQQIILRHWAILRSDPVLLSGLNIERPQFVFRHGYNLSLRDTLSPSMLPEKRQNKNWLQTVRTYKCGANVCKCCRFIKTSKEIQSTYTGKIYEFNTYVNCKTTRRLKDRILEHLACINRKDTASVISAHIIDELGANENFVSFQAIETVKLGKRKGDIDRLLSKRKIKWILLLETVTPWCLNRECDIK
ncbi:hypothetical protein XELAEV_18004776mg [Xenopus laevis]|uniref:Helix-turn-helix domain-containing protein n=1 Tax=Xenopus laevis TaxID=8355 RepID=A0A974DXU5_XENLA|nr:hypothetical protein XELAEV_18004776mg [Xenopus laevis]